MAKTLAVTNRSNTVSGPDLGFGVQGRFSGTGVRTQRLPGTYSNLWTRITANTNTSAGTVVSKKNGSPGNMTVTIPANTSGTFEDTTHTDTIVAGDTYDGTVNMGSGGTCTQKLMNALFDATTNTSIHFMGQTNWIAATGNQFAGLVGTIAPTATEIVHQLKVKTAGVLEKFCFVVSINGRSATSTVGSRVNGANGALTVSVGSGATGTFEDTTHSDTVVVGDLINWYSTTTNANTMSAMCYVGFTTTDSTTQYLQRCGAVINLSTTQYHPISGANDITGATETDTQSKVGIAQILSKYEVYVSANTVSAASTMRPRVGGANVNGAISITASTTGWFEDVSSTDSVVASDVINWQLVTGGAGTSLTLEQVSMKGDMNSGVNATSTIAITPGGSITAAVDVVASSARAIAPGGSVVGAIDIAAVSSLSLALGGSTQGTLDVQIQNLILVSLGGVLTAASGANAASSLLIALAGLSQGTVSLSASSSRSIPVGATSSATIGVAAASVLQLILAGVLTATTGGALPAVGGEPPLVATLAQYAATAALANVLASATMNQTLDPAATLNPGASVAAVA